jgi:hypothetical protein
MDAVESGHSFIDSARLYEGISKLDSNQEIIRSSLLGLL